jgi:hypothetical protein
MILHGSQKRVESISILSNGIQSKIYCSRHRHMRLCSSLCVDHEGASKTARTHNCGMWNRGYATESGGYHGAHGTRRLHERDQLPKKAALLQGSCRIAA